LFQPHLSGRTKDFADDFAKSLSQFDELLLLDIYPAREQLPMEGIMSEWLLQSRSCQEVNLKKRGCNMVESDAR
jgi:UDP-N-acetylmuramate--alanine ligase